MSAVTLCYWDIRGIAQPIVLMLQYLGVEYMHKKLQTNDEGEKDWFGVEKQRLKKVFDFPNLPYLMDGDTMLTESFAIMRYLARKHKDLLPLTEEEIQQADIAQGVVQDLRTNFMRALYDGHVKFEPEGRKNYKDQIQGKLEGMEKVLKRQAWMAGQNPTFVDFAMCEYLDQLRLCYPDVLEEYPSVKQYVDNFDALVKIKEYKNSTKYHPFPVYTEDSAWGWTEK